MVDAAARASVPQTAAAVNGVPAVAPAKKGKSKKAAAEDVKPQELLAARINELQGIRDGEREQEIEIEREVKKANRELWGSMAKLDDMAKMTHLQNRCSQLLTDLKRLQRDHKITKTRADKLQKERDSAKSDLTKVTSMRDKLEKLSRETTTDNRKLRAENTRIRDEDVKKRELLQERIDCMIYDVEDVINAREQSHTHSDTLENDDVFRQQFKSFVDQYELRELHFQSALRTKDLEIAYHVAKLDQQKRAQEAESSRSTQLTRQVSTFSQTETELRTQLNIYVEKFKQVEDTLNSSNDLFLTFRKEMEEMSKKTKRLEKENLALSRKHEVTNANIIKMAEERNRTQTELELLRKKNENLEKLCRGMQAQGRSMAAQQSRDEHESGDGAASITGAKAASAVAADMAQQAVELDEGTGSEYADYDEADLSLDDVSEDGADRAAGLQNGLKANGTAAISASQSLNGVAA